MQTHELVAHPGHPPSRLSGIAASARVQGAWLTLRFRLENAGEVIVPPFARIGRADGLWKRTCFELFLWHGEEEAYSEFNLSPSGQFAAYDFAAYRDGMQDRAVPRDPQCTWRPGGRLAIFDAAIPLAAIAEGGAIGLCAVIEEQGGTKSYWALGHPGGAPDFHHPACFAAQLPAPDAP